MALDTLATRGRQIALLERYGQLLTDHQREVCDLYLHQDWSLSEIAKQMETSRAAVHDLVRRSSAAMEEYERRLGLIAEAERRAAALAALAVEISDLRRRLAGLGSALEALG